MAFAVGASTLRDGALGLWHACTPPTNTLVAAATGRLASTAAQRPTAVPCECGPRREGPNWAGARSFGPWRFVGPAASTASLLSASDFGG
jgi:hypothetical protein